MMNHSPIAATVSRLPDRSTNTATCPPLVHDDDAHGIRRLTTKDTRANARNILAIAYEEQQASLHVARMLCERQDWPMGKVRSSARHGNGSASLRQRMASRLGKAGPISYAGPDVDLFDLLVLIAPASTYRPGGAMRRFLSTLHDFKADVALLTLQCEILCHEDAARVAHWTGHYPVLGMWIRPIELDFLGVEERVQAFGQAINAVHAMAHQTSVAAAPVVPARCRSSWDSR